MGFEDQRPHTTAKHDKKRVVESKGVAGVTVAVHALFCCERLSARDSNIAWCSKTPRGALSLASKFVGSEGKHSISDKSSTLRIGQLPPAWRV